MRRRAANPLVPDFPVLPFLTIMLGLMSVMALTTMGISVQQRQQQQETQLVELVGVPSNFLPLYMRARADRLEYLDDDRQWRTVNVFSFISLQQAAFGSSVDFQLPADLIALRNFIIHKAVENRRLSLNERQHTVIMWVDNDNDAVTTQRLTAQFIGLIDLPIRIGMVPILAGEEVQINVEE